MVNLLQHPVCARCPGRRKMQWVLLWFILSGIARDTLSAAEVNGNHDQSQTTSNYFNRETSEDIASFKRNAENSSVHKNLKSVSDLNRTSRSVPRTKMTDNAPEGNLEKNSKLESIQKSPLHPKSIFIFPFYRPGRSNEELKGSKNNDFQNTDNLMARFGISNDAFHAMEINENSVSKRHDTIIPMVRFGRTDGQKRGSNSYSVIPYPRLGRSLSQNVNQLSESTNEKLEDEMEGIPHYTSEDENEIESFEDTGDNDKDQEQERELEDYDAVISYSKPGSEYFESRKLSERKVEEDLDYILPQIRYGRSMLLFSPPKTEEATKQKPPHTFVLPYPRPGRSSKYRIKVGNSKTEHLILPYPRPGRSDKNNAKRVKSNNEENQEYILPPSRLGHSSLDTLYELEGIDSTYADDEGFLGLNVNPLFLKSEEKNLSKKPKDKSESSSVFIIPYPRPGKKSLLKINNGKQKSNNVEKGIVDYVLPYPRPGRRSARQQLQKIKNSNENPNIQPQNFILPYPRPGRSINYSFRNDDEVDENDINQVENLSDERHEKYYSGINEDMESEDYENNIMNSLHFSQKLNTKFENSLSPYERLARDYQNILPYPRPGRSIDEFKGARLVDEETNTDLKESDNAELNSEMFFSGDNSDHLRYKRSTSVVPYPRLGRSGTVGRSDSIVPYPRFGKSDLVVSHPRLERSDSVVPYPRLGRSNTIVQYPRFKKSNSVVPYPRLGRSNSVVPYPRLGRSNSAVPYASSSRSESLVPYPRPGRSYSVVPYPRPGRSGGIVPYPRPGRSDAVVPYPRPGRSGGIVPYPRPGRAGDIVPYPRPGRSDAVVPYPRPGRSGGIVPYPRPGRSGGIVPYPRPGRSNAVVPYPRPGRTSAIVPYPRPGRSDTLVPYPRPGRSNAVVPYLRPGRTVSVVPYPRPGRSNAIVPYPRPGRSNAMVPYPRPGKSLSGIPYPAMGRSDAEKTVSSTDYNQMGNGLIPNIRPGRSNSKRGDTYVVPYPRPGRSEDTTNQLNKEQFRYTFVKKGQEEHPAISNSKFSHSKKGQGYILQQPRIGRSENDLGSERDRIDTDTVIPYPRLGRSQKQITPSPDVVNSVHKLNKHMITRVDDSIYLLPYPRPGRYSE